MNSSTRVCGVVVVTSIVSSLIRVGLWVQFHDRAILFFHYSRLPPNTYPSITDCSYGLWGSMTFQDCTKNRQKILIEIRAFWHE